MDVASDLAPLPVHPNAPLVSAKTKKPSVHVSPAVLTAGSKDGETLLQDLGTSLAARGTRGTDERTARRFNRRRGQPPLNAV
jgi:hypothetical protein